MYSDNPKFDDKDAAILLERQAKWDARKGPRVGDWVLMLDGTERRFTHNWGETIQTTVGSKHPCNGDASFYFSGDCMSFSGSLDSAIPKIGLVDTGETRAGSAWFFHHGQSGAHRGVCFKTPCRVFRQVAP